LCALASNGLEAFGDVLDGEKNGKKGISCSFYHYGALMRRKILPEEKSFGWWPGCSLNFFMVTTRSDIQF